MQTFTYYKAPVTTAEAGHIPLEHGIAMSKIIIHWPSRTWWLVKGVPSGYIAEYVEYC